MSELRQIDRKHIPASNVVRAEHTHKVQVKKGKKAHAKHDVLQTKKHSTENKKEVAQTRRRALQTPRPKAPTARTWFPKIVDWAAEKGPRFVATTKQVLVEMAKANSNNYRAQFTLASQDMQKQAELMPITADAIKNEFNAKVAQTNHQADMNQAEGFTYVASTVGMGAMGLKEFAGEGGGLDAEKDLVDSYAGEEEADVADSYAEASPPKVLQDYQSELEEAGIPQENIPDDPEKQLKLRNALAYQNKSKPGKVLTKFTQGINACAEKATAFNMMAQIGKSFTEQKYLSKIANAQENERDATVIQRMADQSGQIRSQAHHQADTQAQNAGQAVDSAVQQAKSTLEAIFSADRALTA